MGRMARVVLPKYPHHVVQRGVRSMDIFYGDEDRKEYLRLLSEFADRYEVSIWAWCLMTNHIHLVVVPKEKSSMGRGIGEAHRRYTRYINVREDVRGHLFQERFHSFPIQKDWHLLAVVRYVAQNPVAAGMVKYAADYQWSSTRYYVNGKKDPLVKASPLKKMIHNWKRFLQEENGVEEIEKITQHGRTGRPWGNASWVSGLEKRLDRVLTPQQGGWPKGKSRKKKRK